MIRTDVRETVVAVIQRVLQDSGRPVPALSDDENLTGDIGLDSLDLAVLVVGLEQELGVDPFRAGAAPVATVGSLVDLYTQHLASPSNDVEGDGA